MTLLVGAVCAEGGVLVTDSMTSSSDTFDGVGRDFQLRRKWESATASMAIAGYWVVVPDAGSPRGADLASSAAANHKLRKFIAECDPTRPRPEDMRVPQLQTMALGTDSRGPCLIHHVDGQRYESRCGIAVGGAALGFTDAAALHGPMPAPRSVSECFYLAQSIATEFIDHEYARRGHRTLEEFLAARILPPVAWPLEVAVLAGSQLGFTTILDGRQQEV